MYEIKKEYTAIRAVNKIRSITATSNTLGMCGSVNGVAIPLVNFWIENKWRLPNWQQLHLRLGNHQSLSARRFVDVIDESFRSGALDKSAWIEVEMHNRKWYIEYIDIAVISKFNIKSEVVVMALKPVEGIRVLNVEDQVDWTQFIHIPKNDEPGPVTVTMPYNMLSVYGIQRFEAGKKKGLEEKH